MNDLNPLSPPQGGKTETRLVNLLVDSQTHKKLKDLLPALPDISLNERQICDFELLSTGVFSPLESIRKIKPRSKYPDKFQ